MKRCLIIFALLQHFFATANFAQSHYELINPDFLPSDLFGSHHLPDGAFEVYGKEYELRSTDSGLHWKASKIDQTLASKFSATKWIDFFNGWSTMKRFAFDSTLLYTSNAGNSWSAVNTHVIISNFVFISKDTGWVLTTSGEVRTTFDGGITWRHTVQLSKGQLYSIWALEKGKGLFVGIPLGSQKAGGLFRSTNFGKTWDTLDFTQYDSSAGSKLEVSNIWERNASNFRAFVDTVVYTTSDGGDTWSSARVRVPDVKRETDVESKIASVYPLDSDTAWATGDFDEIFRTTNGGREWIVLDTGKKVTRLPDGGYYSSPGISGLWIVSPNRIIKYGRAGLLSLSTDGGFTWDARTGGFTIDALGSVSFVDKAYGMVGSQNGSAFKTSDGGRSWSPSPLGDLESFTNSISLLDHTHALATVSFDSAVYRTIDFGSTWSRSEIPGLQRFNSHSGLLEKVLLLSLDTGYACGFKGNFCRTTDGGVHWQKLDMPRPFGIHDLSFIDSKEGWAVGDSGLVIHTNDAGNSWIIQNTNDTPIPNAGNYIATLRCVSFSDRLHGVVAGDRGRVFYTSDGGSTWMPGSPSDPAMTSWSFGGYSRLKRFSDNTVWAKVDISGQGGGTTWSSDGGATWASDTSLALNGLNDMSFVTKDLGYLVGPTGIMFKYDSQQQSAPNSSNTKNQYLDIKFSPSPATDMMHCTVYGLYSVQDVLGVRLSIVDMLGREVMDLSALGRMQNTGTSIELTFSTSTLGSGGYLMRMSSSNGSVIRPFMVVH